MFDFDGMLAALRDENAMDDYEVRKSVLGKYKAEITTLLIAFRGAKIIGKNEIPIEPAVNCDPCGCDVSEDSVYADGMINDGSGMWSNMCVQCFLAHGSGIGWGVGQLYAHNGAYWHCIGGGNPDACNEDET